MSIDHFHDTSDRQHDVHADILDNDQAAHVQIVDGEVVPLVPDVELPDNFPPPTLEHRDEVIRDLLDVRADQLGSYADARKSLGESEPTGDFSADAMRKMIEEKNGVPMSPTGKSTGKYVSGPQLGEETAPHVDQRVTDDQDETIRRNIREKIDPILARIADKKLITNATELGVKPEVLVAARK